MTSRILLVEDDSDIRESLKEVLEDEGYLVGEAGNGVEALAHLRAHALPQLILLDLMMPVMNGVQFQQELVKTPAWRAIPIVVLSADADARRKAAAMHAFDVIEKPVELEQLFELVARAVDVSTSP